MIRHWLVMAWLALLPNTPVPHDITAPTLNHVTSNSAPIVNEKAPGESMARAQKLPYLLAKQTTNYYHAIPSQAKNIELSAKRLNGTVIQPGAIFSYYKVVGPYSEANGYGLGRGFYGDRIVPSIGGGVCQGASTLYATILRTGLHVVERHQHGLMVPYLPPGEDATVSSDYLNFKFQNTRTTPVLITARAENRHFTIALWGATPGPHITVRHKILARYPYRTVTHYNAKLAPGTEKVIAPGQDGVKVDSWLEIQTKKGVVKQPLGIDTYRASPRIIEKSTKS